MRRAYTKITHQSACGTHHTSAEGGGVGRVRRPSAPSAYVAAKHFSAERRTEEGLFVFVPVSNPNRPADPSTAPGKKVAIRGRWLQGGLPRRGIDAAEPRARAAISCGSSPFPNNDWAAFSWRLLFQHKTTSTTLPHVPRRLPPPNSTQPSASPHLLPFPPYRLPPRLRPVA